MSKPLKVLISESERYRKIMLNILTRDSRLRALDIEVIQAADGEEAFSLFQTHRPDLLITELLLPKKSGFELIRAIRQLPEGEDTPILLTTGLTRDMTTVHVLKRSFNVQLQSKPFTPWDFALNIQKLLTPTRPPARGKDSDSQKEISSSPGLRRKVSTRPFSSTDAQQDPDATGPEDSESGVTRPGFPAQPLSLTRTPSLIDIKLDMPEMEGESDDRAPDRAGRTERGSRRFTQGNLTAHPLPELLLDALEKKLSGTLALRLDKIKKVIYLLEGHPIYVQSNLRRETIGQTLVRKGLLTSDHNARTLGEAKRLNIPYGQAVVKLGFLTSQQVKEELVANIRYKIESSLDWSSGNWLFVEDPQVGARVPRCVLDPVKVVFQGLKTSLNVEHAMQRLANYQDRELQLRPRFQSYRGAFIESFGQAVASALSPGMTVSGIVQAVGNPHEALFQVDILLRTGLMRLIRPRKDAVETAETPEATKTDSEGLEV